VTRSTALKNAILDAICNNTPLQVAAAYISLHTADPGGNGASEVAGGGYARQPGSFEAAGTGAAGECRNDAIIDFTVMPACTVTYVGVWSALAGVWYWGGILTAQKVVNAGDTFRFIVNALNLKDVDV